MGMDKLSLETFATSDQHYKHANIIKYCNRPFPTANLMDAELIKNYNEVVGEDDTTLHLGDLTFEPEFVSTLGNQLQGKKLFIARNHDGNHSVYNHKPQKVRTFRNKLECGGFKVLPEQYMFLCDGILFKACHLPYHEPDDAGYEVRYIEYRPKPEHEKILLCGHVHIQWKMKKHSSGRIMYNVGVDVHNFRPVQFHQILSDVEEFRDSGDNISL